MDADDDGAAVVDDAGDSIASVGVVADTLAEAAGMVAPDEGLVGVAAQAPTEIATMTATLALTTARAWTTRSRSISPPDEVRSHSAVTVNGRRSQEKVPSPTPRSG